MRVAVIGAGPVGCYIAWKLALRGESVALFDKRKNPYKPCSGLYSRRILHHVPLSENLIENEIFQININFPSGKKISLVLKQPIFVVDRKKFNVFMLELAKKSGARFFCREVKKVSERGEVVFSSGKKEKFDAIIACDGALSAARRSLSLPEPEYFLGVLTKVNKRDFSCVCETFATEHGFFWKIPRGSKTEYGIMEKPSCARQKFREFCKKFGVKARKIESALIPVGPVISPHPNIFLCGDAAGLCKPWSGGGIIWAFESADIMLRHFPDLEKANKEVKRKFGKRLMLSRLLTKLVKKHHTLLPGRIKFDPDKVF